MTVPDQQAQADLQRLLDERLAAFAGQVTHDLKTPLTTMSLSLELIRDELEDGAAAEDLLPLITRAVRGAARMSAMIEDVLVFARVGTSVEPVPVDLAKVVSDVVADLGSALDDVRLDVGKLPVLPGDESLLRSLMLNLIGNAAKFREPERSPEVRVEARRAGERWRVEVADNGVGVAEDQRERVFEPSVRLDKRVEGLGIGLATCRRVVDAHGGVIGVEPNPAGSGSVFWVELPAGAET